MEDITEQLLKELSVNSFFNSLELSSRLSLDHQKVVGAIKSLQSLGNVSVLIYHYLMLETRLISKIIKIISKINLLGN